MSNSHISIPELEQRQLTYEEFYRAISIMLQYDVRLLCELHPSEAINDLVAYPLQIAKRIVKTAKTLHIVVEQEHDYVVANTIVRSLADSISTLALIYLRESPEECALRHYLYIIDGTNGRLKQMPPEMVYDGRIGKDEFDALKDQVENAKSNYSKARDFSVAQIHNLKLYNEKKSLIDKLVDNGNWKFKTLGSAKNNYSWKEMYQLLNMKVCSHFISSLSEFTHGLSTSNMVVEDAPSTFESIYGIAICLLGNLREYLWQMYEHDKELVKTKMLPALLDEGMPAKYVQFIMNEYKKRYGEGS